MSPRPTVRSLESDAASLLTTYCSPSSGYAWPIYDDDINRDRLLPTDVLAPAFLSYPIKGTYIQRMFDEPTAGTEPNPYNRLLRALDAVISDETAENLNFADIEFADLQNREVPGWGKVLAAMDFVQPCRGLTSVAVTKILHRKRPRLVPINDSRVRSFYGLGNQGYAPLVEAIHSDLQDCATLLQKWIDDLGTHPLMTPLRCLDIVIWMSYE